MQSSQTPLRVALIGGSGFIGQSLGPLLMDAGHWVRVIDVVPLPVQIARSEFVSADVRDAVKLHKALAGCDLIVNLAAVHRDDVRPLSLYSEVNVEGARNICGAAQNLGVRRIIFTSSVAIYGMQNGTPDETRVARPFNAYGRTKWEAEAVYTKWQKAAPANRSLSIIRPTVVFGPGNRGNVHTLIAQLAGGKFVMVGTGENRKSMAYVKNVAAFLAHLAAQERGASIQIYNYADKPDFSMNELLALIRSALGRSPPLPIRIPYALGLLAGSAFDALAFLSGRTFPISRVRVQKFCASTIFSTDRLRTTGFVAPFELKQGLLDTIRAEFAEDRHPALAERPQGAAQ